jgi:hypothetical protein
MVRSIAILIVSMALVGISGASDNADVSTIVEQSAAAFHVDKPTPSTAYLESLGIESPRAVAAQQGCCKICRVGKACGNTCISRDKVCHVGPGCACDG